eukprot:2152476-Rhodomonas_salina.2
MTEGQRFDPCSTVTSVAVLRSLSHMLDLSSFPSGSSLAMKCISNDVGGRAGQYEVGCWDGATDKTVQAAFKIPASDFGVWVHIAGVYDGQCWKLFRYGGTPQSHPRRRISHRCFLLL